MKYIKLKPASSTTNNIINHIKKHLLTWRRVIFSEVELFSKVKSEYDPWISTKLVWEYGEGQFGRVGPLANMGAFNSRMRSVSSFVL